MLFENYIYIYRLYAYYSDCDVQVNTRKVKLHRQNTMRDNGRQLQSPYNIRQWNIQSTI